MEIYAPFSKSHGNESHKRRIEDLSFLKLNPEPRKLIVDRLSLNKMN